MKQKTIKISGGRYKYTLLDNIVYFLSLKRTSFVLLMILFFEIDYQSIHLAFNENIFASVPDMFWETFAFLVLICYEIFMSFIVMGLPFEKRNKFNNEETLSKNYYIMKIKPRICCLNVWVKFSAVLMFVIVLFLLIFSSVPRVDFTENGIAKYDILGKMTYNCSYKEIKKCNISCDWSRQGKSGYPDLFVEITFSDGGSITVDVNKDTVNGLHSLSALKSKLKNAEITYSEYVSLEEHIDWHGNYTQNEIDLLYELFNKK